MKQFAMILLISVFFLTANGVLAVNSYAATAYDQCVLEKVANEDEDASLKAIKNACFKRLTGKSNTVEMGPISNRVLSERTTQWNRFVITPHKRNYFLPYTHTSKVNRKAYERAGEEWSDEIKHYESEFQVSLKVPLNYQDIFRENDALYIGFTLNAWWQVYADNISAPFRETNYQPEIFYLTGIDWHPFKGNTGLMLGVEHQSNGRSQFLSRSWNRIYAALIFEKDNLAISVRPWYRLKEDKKDSPEESDGDDNPDIEHYMGHFELTAAYKTGRHELSFLGRNNLRSENRGAFELGWSFPMYGHLRGFVQYFNGYGESLIDYDFSQERIGVGILLTDIL